MTFRDGVNHFLQGAASLNVVYYALPTFYRMECEGKEPVKGIENRLETHDGSTFMGMVAGLFFGGTTQFIAYVEAANGFEHPQVYLAPVLTNAVSLWHERKKIPEMISSYKAEKAMSKLEGLVRLD